MSAEQASALSKTTRINSLFDFYETLLTEKQRTILSYYYHDDFSLGEIATEFTISRQAVYDNIRRAEQALESYESKLKLLQKHTKREQLILQLQQNVEQLTLSDQDKHNLMQGMQLIHQIDQIQEGGDGSWQHLKA